MSLTVPGIGAPESVAVEVVEVAPGQPVVVIKRIGCMSEIPLPDQSLLRKPIEKHEHAPLEEHRPSEGEIVMLSGAVRRDN